MKSITINGSKRESVGKSSSKALRNAGQVPCVLYGGDGPIHFSAPELAFSKLVYTANAYTVVIALSDNESYSAVLQDIQFHPVSDKILHVDFYQLFEDKKIAMDIPVRLVGNAIGVKLGGNLQRNKRKLRIRIRVFYKICCMRIVNHKQLSRRTDPILCHGSTKTIFNVFGLTLRRKVFSQII